MLNFVVCNLLIASTGNFKIFKDKMIDLQDNLFTKFKHITIAVDFNVDFTSPNANTLDLLNVIRSYGMNFPVSVSTRITNTNELCLDNVLTNYPHNLSTANVYKYFISDHKS